MGQQGLQIKAKHKGNPSKREYNHARFFDLIVYVQKESCEEKGYGRIHKS